MNTETHIFFPFGLDLGEFTPALTLSSDFKFPKERHGRPVQYWEKQMIKPGLRLPDKRTGKFQNITEERVARMCADTKLAMSRGYEPSIRIGSHDKAIAKPGGWIADVRIDPTDKSLIGLHAFIGTEEEVRDLVAKYKSSINTVENCHNGEHVYGEIITHNALVDDPYINLKDFVPAIAASRGQAIDVVELSLAAPTTEVQMDLSKLRTRLGAAADVPDEKLVDMADIELGKLATLTAANAEATGKVTSLSRDLEAANLKLSRSDEDAPKPSKFQMYHLGKALSLARDEAAKAAGARVVTEVQKRYLGVETFDAGGLSLSREVKEDDAKTAAGIERAIEILDVLALAQPPIRQQPKGIALARQATENAADLGKQDDKAAEAAGLAQGEEYKNEQLKARGLPVAAV